MALATERAAAAEPATRWLVTVMATLAGIVCCLQLGKVPPALPLLRETFGFGMVFGGFFSSSFILTAALVGLPAGALINRIGAVRALTLAMLVTGAGSLLGAFAASGALLLASRLIESLGFVVVAVSAPALVIASAAPRDRSLAIGIWGVYLPAGVAAGILAAPLFLAGGGFRGFWLVNGLACVVCAGLVHRLLMPVPGLQSVRRANAWAGAAYLRTPTPWLFVLSFAVYGGQYHAVVTWLPTMLVERFGFAIGAASTASATVAFMSALGSLASGWTTHRGMGRSSVLALSFLGLMLGAWAVFASELGAGPRIGFACLFAFCGGSIAGLCIAGAPSRARSASESSLANGLLVQGSNVGGALGPPALAAVVSASGGWSSAWWSLCLLSAAGLALAAAVRGLVERGPVRP